MAPSRPLPPPYDRPTPTHGRRSCPHHAPRLTMLPPSRLATTAALAPPPPFPAASASSHLPTPRIRAPSPTAQFFNGTSVLRDATHASPSTSSCMAASRIRPPYAPRLRSPIWKHRHSHSTIGSSPITLEYAIGDRCDLAIRDRRSFDNAKCIFQITPHTPNAQKRLGRRHWCK